jgi:hypothetical protein
MERATGRRVVSLIGWAVVLFLATCLVLAAVGRVREEARRTQCVNNVRAIGFALLNYYDVNRRFPAATVADRDLPPERRLSWLFELDVYVHARMDPDWKPQRGQPWDSEENLKLVRTRRMLWYVCPGVGQETGTGGLALTHYVGAAGVGADAARLPKGDPLAGVFGYDRWVKQEEITDGLSTTATVIETGFENGPWTAGGRATTRELDPADQPVLGHGRPFGGTHRGGTWFGFADASARFLPNSTDPAVLAALVTVARGDDPGPLPAE